MTRSGKRRCSICTSLLATGQPTMMSECRRGSRSASVLRCSWCTGRLRAHPTSHKREAVGQERNLAWARQDWCCSDKAGNCGSELQVHICARDADSAGRLWCQPDSASGQESLQGLRRCLSKSKPETRCRLNRCCCSACCSQCPCTAQLPDTTQLITTPSRTWTGQWRSGW